MTACRFCAAPLLHEFVDFGDTPLANSYLPPTPEACEAERTFPLRVMVCDSCWLVQTTETIPADEIFTHDYAYLSSYSTEWVAHAQSYVEAMTERFGIDANSRVVEVASNDGYLLQWFAQQDVPVLGVEPAGHAAEIAESRGVATHVAFFGEQTARELHEKGFVADLMVANNVLAHVPNLRDFATGFAVLLKPSGVATFEFPHLANLIRFGQFDTIYHEHYSYLLLLFVERLMQTVGLEVFDVEMLPTHGGSLRVFVGHPGMHPEGPGLTQVRMDEAGMELDTISPYTAFGERVEQICINLRTFVDKVIGQGKTVAAYGAPAKGNTFLNVAGIGADRIAFTVDRNPEKQGMLLPGSHIPVYAPEHISAEKPDYLLILPWNLSDEIANQQAAIRDWGGKFVTVIPDFRVF